MQINIERECVICGSGLAGLMTAFHLKDMQGLTLLSIDGPAATNSYRAQGGIACVTDPSDHVNRHIADTMTAGHFTNDPEAVACLVKEGTREVHDWIRQGLPLDRDTYGRLLAGQEGAHSFKRILHAGGDQTGKAFMQFMVKQLDDRVETMHQGKLVDVSIEPDGRLLLDVRKNNGQTIHIRTRQLIFATGGIGGLFEQSSNHPDMTGTAIAIAQRIGIKTHDLHLIQYHPTLLRGADGTTRGLISEAVRGEGARIVTEDGTRVMEGIHPLEDLAPRDVVAFAMYKKEQEGHQLFLDITMIPDFIQRFPQVYYNCKHAHIHPENGLLPVTTGVHFHMGGLQTNLHGETSIPGIYAVGEAASTGVHGANRLASNSLLECVTFSKRVAHHIQHADDPSDLRRTAYHTRDMATQPDIDLPKLNDLKRIMTGTLGIHPDPAHVQSALKDLNELGVPGLTRLSLQAIDTETCERINQWTAAWTMLNAANVTCREGQITKSNPSLMVHK